MPRGGCGSPSFFAPASERSTGTTVPASVSFSFTSWIQYCDGSVGNPMRTSARAVSNGATNGSVNVYSRSSAMKPMDGPAP